MEGSEKSRGEERIRPNKEMRNITEKLGRVSE